MSARNRIYGWVVMASLLLAGCSDDGLNMPNPTEVGMRATIYLGGKTLSMDVTGVEGALVRTEVTSQGQIVALRDYYRGLIPVSGTEKGRGFKFDFETRKLEKLFPLDVGTSVSFKGKLKLEGRPEPLVVVVQASVVKEKTISLKNSIEKVKIIEVERIYHTEAGLSTQMDTYYYSERLGVTLKSVTRTEKGQSYWYVTNIDLSASGTNNQRRPGSVMI